MLPKSYLLVTGGAGFIGSNLVHRLNQVGARDIVVVDDLSDGNKFKNLVGADFFDYWDRRELLDMLHNNDALLDGMSAVFHLGACTDTTELDGRWMMENNYTFSKHLLHRCQERRVPFLYASSAAVYGASGSFRVHPDDEHPLNVYGFSKLMFDNHVRRVGTSGQLPIVGLRYFNVYGPREAHKGPMASMVHQLHQQCLQSGQLRLFEGSHGRGDGEQSRDFVDVRDVVAVMLWFWRHPQVSGLFNVGTGRDRSFREMAQLIMAHHQRGQLQYVPFPDGLQRRYQAFTRADLAPLRDVGCDVEFQSLEEGVASYLAWLDEYGDRDS